MAADAINQATDKWLTERSQAPLDRLKDWLVDKSQPLMERLGTVMGGKRLLDAGGETAELVVLGKLIACNAVDLDEDIVSKVETAAELYSEAASRIEMGTGELSKLSYLVDGYKQRCQIYRQVLDVIRTIPEHPPVTDVERDAMRFLKLRQAQAHVGLRSQVGGPMGTRRSINNHDSFRLCLDEDSRASNSWVENQKFFQSPSASSFAKPQTVPVQNDGARIEQLMQELFRTQDLKGDGMFDEDELIMLNEKIAMLHYGRNADIGAVHTKYSSLFRSRLDPQGNPVPYMRFRDYMLQVVRELDADPRSQEMILEQILNEARSALAAFATMDSSLMSTANFGSIEQTREKMQTSYFGTDEHNYASSYPDHTPDTFTSIMDPAIAAEDSNHSIVSHQSNTQPNASTYSINAYETPQGSHPSISSHQGTSLGMQKAAEGINQSILSYQSQTSQSTVGSKAQPSIFTASSGYATKDAARQAASRLALQKSTTQSQQQQQPLPCNDTPIEGSVPSGLNTDPFGVMAPTPSIASGASYNNGLNMSGISYNAGSYISSVQATSDHYALGDPVSIYSQSEDSWLAGCVVRAEGHTVEIEYQARDGSRRGKTIDLHMPKLSKILRPASKGAV
mmetsp:Transcript_93799/g.146488  ORF Transcript_93799/g.146488 Transcript_93799/m.146488 type:complete len:623 (+) Transcript_93799:77-1945(+)